jgi:hypothetical protein
MKTIVVVEEPGRGRREAEFEIPAGWYRVLSGAVKPGDRFLSVDVFWRTGEIVWDDLTKPPPPAAEYGSADWYVCLIRRGEPVEVLCPRCHSAPVRHGYRYCEECSTSVVKELRSR